MEIIFFLLLGAATGFWIAQYMYMGALRNILDALDVSDDDLRKVAEELGVTVPPKQPQTVEIDGETFEYDEYVEVRVEKVDNVFFAYRDDTDVFIAQSNDASELVEVLADHFPARTRVNIDPANGGKYLQDVAEKG